MSKVIPSSRPSWYAERVLRDLGIFDPPVNLESVLDYFGLAVFEFSPSEYSLVGNSVFGPQKINGFLSYEDDLICVLRTLPKHRKKTTIAHEIGHYDLPWHSATGFVSMGDEFRRVRLQEREAFDYAAELLMPMKCFSDYACNQLPSIAHVKKVAKCFDVSFEFAAMRFVKHCDYPVCTAVIIPNPNAANSGNQFKIKYAVSSKHFPRSFLSTREIRDCPLICDFMDGRGASTGEFSGRNLSDRMSWMANCELKWHGERQALVLLTLPRTQGNFHKKMETVDESRIIRQSLFGATGRQRSVNIGTTKSTSPVRSR